MSEPETKVPCRPGCTNHIDCVIAAWSQPQSDGTDVTGVTDGVFALHPEEVEIMVADCDRFRRALETIRDGYLSVEEMIQIAQEELELES